MNTSSAPKQIKRSLATAEAAEKQEAEKQEAEKQEAEKQEAEKQEAEKQEAEKQEATASRKNARRLVTITRRRSNPSAVIFMRSLGTISELDTRQ